MFIYMYIGYGMQLRVHPVWWFIQCTQNYSHVPT